MKLYDPSTDRIYTGRIVALVGLVVVIGLIIGLGIYALTYSTADTRGRIALHNQQRSPTALQFNYEYFHDTCHSVLALSSQATTVSASYDALKAATPASDPFGQYAQTLAQKQTDLDGIKNQRDQVAQQYNSRSHQFTRDFVKSKDLPAEIGPPTGTPYATLTCEGAQA